MRCEICGDELLPGLVKVGIKTCLKCRDKAAWLESKKPKDEEYKAKVREAKGYHPSWSGYAGNGCGGFRESHNKF